MLEVRHISKRYGRVLALSDVSFNVRPGEILGLIGPNGAGKTTLFECLAGVLHRDSGTVTAIGESFAAPDGIPPFFYVPDGVAPWPAESVRWVLDYMVGFFGGDSAAIDGIGSELDLAPLLDVRIGALSKGQRKRALIGAGLITRSPILMIDEPFDGLDLRQSRSLAAVLKSHAARGRTFFLSVHQIADAARVCDRFVLLGAGSVRGEGSLPELSVSAGLPSAGSTADLEEVFLALT